MTAEADGPHFEDLRHGDVYDTSPAVTLTDGVAAAHRMVVGDRLRLTLDAGLSHRVTGRDRPVASPALVWDTAIGQSTVVTQHVRANLFYRGLAFRRLPSLGDTLRTSTEVVALRQNRVRPDRPSTGLVVLRISTCDQQDRPVLEFTRCAMVLLRDPTARTAHADDLSALPTPYGADHEVSDAAAGWRLDSFEEGLPTRLRRPLRPGTVWHVASGDVVSAAPELARLTLNLARTHHDDASGARLVYGGHTIGLALSQAVRAVPELVTVLAWDACDHLGPVHEGDTLTSAITLEQLEPRSGGGRRARLRTRVTARSGPRAEPREVLDWGLVALLP